MKFLEEIAAYAPRCEQEAADRRLMLELAGAFPKTILTRECRAAHLTSSGFIVNPEGTRTLMVFHNIYGSWTWTGGHADGEGELLPVALREAMEETGVARVRPLSEEIASLDVLAVSGHVKRGAYVSAHLHLNAAYLLVAEEGQPLRAREGENSGVRWLPLDRLGDYCTEPEMLPVYEKLVKRMKELL